MLQYCAAVIIASSEWSETFVRHLADQVGFGRVVPYDLDWPPTPITFFLVDANVPEEEKNNVIAAVRGNGMFRFSPMLLIGAEGRPPAKTFAEYEQLGFDDAFIASGDMSLLKVRIESQLRDERTYYSTATYFGPDRRRWERVPSRASVGQTQPAANYRYRIRRNPLTGIELVEQVRQESEPDGPAGIRYRDAPAAES